MKNLILFLPLLGQASLAFAGDKVGNGGDFIRAGFLQRGETVVRFLQNNPEGQKITRAHNLDLSVLNNSLLAEKIQVVGSGLTDNGGSLADATGEPDKIRLDRGAWKEHFDKSRDVYYLVFHEMLREARYNDDDYRISKKINPFSGKKDCDCHDDEISRETLFMREQFQMARRPTEADLRLGESWTCVAYSARKGEGTGVYDEQPVYQFSKIRGSRFDFRNRARIKPQFFEYYSRSYDPIRKEFGELSGVGALYPGFPDFDYVRVNQDGDLVAEMTASHPRQMVGLVLQSIADCKRKVSNYFLCKTKW